MGDWRQEMGDREGDRRRYTEKQEIGEDCTDLKISAKFDISMNICSRGGVKVKPISLTCQQYMNFTLLHQQIFIEVSLFAEFFVTVLRHIGKI